MEPLWLEWEPTVNKGEISGSVSQATLTSPTLLFQPELFGGYDLRPQVE